MFSAAGPQEGKLTGAQVKPVMLQSSLPSSVLAKVENIFVIVQKYFGCVHQVWTLADADGDGLLDEAEFCLAMYLIDHKLSGHDLPASLPPHLRPPGTAARHVTSCCHITSCCNVISRNVIMLCCHVQSTSCGPSCPRTARPRGLRWGRARPAAARAPCPRAAGRRTWSSREDGWGTPSKLCYFTIYLYKAFNQT